MEIKNVLIILSILSCSSFQSNRIIACESSILNQLKKSFQANKPVVDSLNGKLLDISGVQKASFTATPAKMESGIKEVALAWQSNANHLKKLMSSLDITKLTTEQKASILQLASLISTLQAGFGDIIYLSSKK